MSDKYDRYHHFIFVCKDKDCKKAGAKELKKEFEFQLKRQHLHKMTKVIGCECTDRCKEAPVIVVNDNWLGNVKVEEVEGMVQQYLQEK